MNLAHPKENERMEAVYKLGILDTPQEQPYDDLTKDAIDRLAVPISTISIIDNNREWFKSCQGMATKEGPREIAFCSYAMLAENVFIIEDTHMDDRFKNNPYVTGYPYVRFYAGIALYDSVSRLPVGVFCVKDIKPRKLTLEEMGIFMEIAEKVEQLINSRERVANTT